MTVTTLTSRDFNQDVSKAKRATRKGPVFITDRGRTAHVLLSVEDYQALSHDQRNIAELLAMPDAADIEFDPQPTERELYRPPDFS